MQKPETKTCPPPCGKVFERDPDQTNNSWALAKYCPEHAAMNSTQRAKLGFKATPRKKRKKSTSKPAVKSKKIINKTSDAEQKSPSSFVPKGDAPAQHLIDSKEFAQQTRPGTDMEVIIPLKLEGHHVGSESKICAYEKCGKEFFRKEESDGTWAVKKYCSTKCSKAASAQMERARKKRKRGNAKSVLVDATARAEEVAMDEVERISRIVVLCLKDTAELDRFKVAAREVGMRCFEAGFREAI